MNQILNIFYYHFGKLFIFISVVVTITYLLSRSERIARLMTIKRSSREVKAALILIMGLLAMVASHVVTITPEKGRSNIRDMFVILAGLLGGPPVGIPVGLIGGIYRYLLGGPTAFGCGIATSIAGVLGSYLYRFKQYKLPRISLKAIGILFLLVLLMQGLHLGLVMLTTGGESIKIITTGTRIEALNMWLSGVAMVTVNAIGVSIFMVIFRGLGLEQLRIQRLIEERERVKRAKEQLEELKSVLEVKVKARTKELEKLTKTLDQKVKERTQELQKRINQLERFHKLTIGRELRMAELKKEIERLQKELKEKK